MDSTSLSVEERNPIFLPPWPRPFFRRSSPRNRSSCYGDLWRVHSQPIPDDRRRPVSIRARYVGARDLDHFDVPTRVLLHAGILDSSKDDFEDGDEVYEAIGQVLHEVADKSENEVRSVNVFALVNL